MTCTAPPPASLDIRRMLVYRRACLENVAVLSASVPNFTSIC